MLLSLVTVSDLELKQLDFETAFLNAPLDEVLYVKQPEGYHSGNANMVWLLKKALYGLKQAPYAWNKEVNAYLVNVLKYKPLYSDPCIYIKQTKHGIIVLCLYVDDTLVAYHSKDEAQWLVSKSKTVASKYVITDLGNANWILNMKVDRDRSKQILHLSQQAYVEQMLISFKMQDCNAISKPCQYDLTL